MGRQALDGPSVLAPGRLAGVEGDRRPWRRADRAHPVQGPASRVTFQQDPAASLEVGRLPRNPQPPEAASASRGHTGVLTGSTACPGGGGGDGEGSLPSGP